LPTIKITFISQPHTHTVHIVKSQMKMTMTAIRLYRC